MDEQRMTMTNAGRDNPDRFSSEPLEYAGFWVRAAATVIDMVLLMVITLPLIYLVYGNLDTQGALARGPMDFLISWVLPAVLTIWFWRRYRATPGKLAISARVVDAETGGAPSVKQCVIRFIGYIVSTIPFGLGYLWIAFDRRKQGWHDKMANTVVVRRAGVEPVQFRQGSDRGSGGQPF